MTYTFTSPDGTMTVDRTEEEFAAFQSENADWTWAVKPPKQEQIEPLAAHLQEVEEAVDVLVAKTLAAHNYISIGEAAALAKVDDSIWQAEALQMCKWYNSIYEAFDAYKVSAEIERKTVSEFIQQLPIFEP
jgi:hypothetical protein